MKKREKIVDFFKLLSNQNRIEILVLLKDRCKSTREISKRLGLDHSTVFRHLKSLEKFGLVKEIKDEKGVKFYDLASSDIYRFLELSISILKGIKTDMLTFETETKVFPENPTSGISLDLRGFICPIPDLEVEKALNNAKNGEILDILVDYPLSKERIVSNSVRSGNEVLSVRMIGNSVWRILIRKGKSGT